MKNILFYLFGIASGYFISDIYQSLNSHFYHTVLHDGYSEQRQINRTEPQPCITTNFSSETIHHEIQVDSVGSNNTFSHFSLANQLLDQLENSSEIDFSSNEFQDLSFLVKKDAALATRLTEIIRASQSYDEKWNLLNILANSHSQETMLLAREMLTDQNDIQTQKLGFEFVEMMDLHQLPDTLNQALIDVTYNQPDTEILEQAIALLSHQTDTHLKAEVQERFQALMPDSNHQIKAAVIDGLAEIDEPDEIQETARSYLSDSDELIRNAAISSLFKLPPGSIDSDLVAALQQLKDDSTTTGSTRRLAAAVLDVL
ncbi:HEAT repeat domain-containing protein [Vibrio quintilis]|uniref:HEAT repeat protein n=1 Tax=Vibrio quintilis TaxID=1117707 RepID=A0A1M7YUQ9_9VIBR|nr:HEAT repeat domain-containing protein [Vibrio quintilis]SHO56308.1 hypothetical protein VQ7734_02077 [Vibrio quintilis]